MSAKRTYSVTVQEIEPGLFEAFACEVSTEESDELLAERPGTIEQDRTAWDAAKNALATAMPEPSA